MYSLLWLEAAILVVIISIIVLLIFIYIKSYRAKVSDWCSCIAIAYPITCFVSMLLLRKMGFDYYDFLRFEHVILPAAIIMIATGTVTNILYYVFNTIFVKKNKDCIFIIGRYKLFPFLSLKATAILFGSIFAVICFMDGIIPQYGMWQIEDYNLKYERHHYTLYSTSYQTLGYPLWNIDGFEDPIENIIEFPEKTILILGDSFVWGDGCNNSNQLWWRVLQKSLIDDGYSKCRVVAVAKRGASTIDQLRWMTSTHMLEDINPDMIIIGYVTNDPQYVNDTPKILQEEDYFNAGILRIFKKIFPNVAYIINCRLNEKRNKMIKLTEETGYPYDLWELKAASGEYLIRYYETTIKPMGEELKSLGIPYFLVTTPSVPSYDYYENKYKEVLPLFEEVGIKVYNSLGDLIELYSANKDYALGMNPVNSHPGTAINMFLGQYVARILKDDYKNFLGEKDSIKRDDKCIPIVNDFFPHPVLPNNDEGGIEFTFPALSDERYLWLPIKKPYIKLSFLHPISPTSLYINQTDLLNTDEIDIEVWATYISEKGYDTHEMLKIGEFKNDVYQINCDINNLTSICLVNNGDAENDIRYLISFK